MPAPTIAIYACGNDNQLNKLRLLTIRIKVGHMMRAENQKMPNLQLKDDIKCFRIEL